jgi:hypothetical protein
VVFLFLVLNFLPVPRPAPVWVTPCIIRCVAGPAPETVRVADTGVGVMARRLWMPTVEPPPPSLRAPLKVSFLLFNSPSGSSASRAAVELGMPALQPLQPRNAVPAPRPRAVPHTAVTTAKPPDLDGFGEGFAVSHAWKWISPACRPGSR